MDGRRSSGFGQRGCRHRPRPCLRVPPRQCRHPHAAHFLFRGCCLFCRELEDDGHGEMVFGSFVVATVFGGICEWEIVVVVAVACCY